MKKVSLYFLFALVPLALFAGGVSDKDLVNTQSVDITGIQSISIRYGAEDVVFLVSPENKLIIKEYMTRDDKSYYASVSKSGGVLEIKEGKRPAFRNFSSKTEVYMPAAFAGSLDCTIGSGRITSEIEDMVLSNVSISGGSGTIIVRNVTGEKCSIKVGSGRISAGMIRASTVLSTSSGDVNVDGVSGTEHSLASSSGNVSAGLVSGTRSELKCSSGKIEVGTAIGIVNAVNSSGSITITGLQGSGNFETNSGTISIGFIEPSGDVSFAASSGNINIAVSKNVAFTLDAETSSGTVEFVTNDGREKIKRESVLYSVGASPEFTIKARVNSGSVNVELK